MNPWNGGEKKKSHVGLGSRHRVRDLRKGTKEIRPTV